MPGPVSSHTAAEIRRTAPSLGSQPEGGQGILGTRPPDLNDATEHPQRVPPNHHSGHYALVAKASGAHSIRRDSRENWTIFKRVLNRDGAGGGFWLRFFLGSHCLTIPGAVGMLLHGFEWLGLFLFIFGLTTMYVFWRNFQGSWRRVRRELRAGA